MRRRTFLESSALASTSMFVPGFLSKIGRSGSLQKDESHILVVIQLSGGNDGLNTLVSYEDDLYYNARPGLGIKPPEVIKLNTLQGLHPALDPLRTLYDNGNMSMINSVGYPNPDRSHFRSMDIWHTASDHDTYRTSGWLGRYLDHMCHDCYAHHAIEFHDTLSLALQGNEQSGFVFENPDILRKAIKNQKLRNLSELSNSATTDSLQDYLYKTLGDTYESADILLAQLNKNRSARSYPATDLGKSLGLISELILNDLDSRIYYTDLSGFDTHVNQKGTHERLLQQYADAISAFIKDLKSQNKFKDVLVLTFSEFGRRVKENGSFGTDHGAGNVVFLFGEDLTKPGIYNSPPDLSALDSGDIRYQVDFRAIYQDILSNWMGCDAEVVLGKRFEDIGVV